MNKKLVSVLAGALVVLLAIVAVFSVINMKNKYVINESVEDVKKKAEMLYAEGNISEAITNLDTYCKYSVTDVAAKATLGDWYMENGENEKAYECYLQAASNKQADGEMIKPLTIKNTAEVVLTPAEEYAFEITPDVRITKDMTLSITGQNLAPRKIEYGKIDAKEYQLTDEDWYYTTEWFDVNPEGSYLTLSGGFNCATWQFADSLGEIIAFAESENRYRRLDSASVNVYQMARVIIPEEAVKCRVTYFNTLFADVTASPEEPISIVYGRLPGESKAAEMVTYDIPDLKTGEKITYKDGVWTHSTIEGESVLSDWQLPIIELGSHILVGGTVPGRVSFEKSSFITYGKEKIYTIQFDLNNPSNTGKRLDDAKNMAFNGAVGEAFLSKGENTFDAAYPWSEIKLCAIKDGTIIYKGEEGFADTGEAGDVFVEIPKFYSKRVVENNLETISISGYPHEGFTLDEAFVTKNGEAEAIYIGAYTASVSSQGKMQSVSHAAPMVYFTPSQMVSMAKEKGEGYEVLDYAALSAIQKLFMVETGVRNSQCLYMGVCGLTMATQDGDESGYSTARNSKTKTNCIDVDEKYSYNQGESIVLYNVLNYNESYLDAIQSPRKITAVIENHDATVSVFFDGDPVDVVAGETAIAHIAKNSGGTDSINYHTGATATSRGIHSFKYRNIENIWGNTHTYIHNVKIKNSVVTITDRKGSEKILSYTLPVLSYNKNTEIMIKQLGYDPLNSSVMLPSVIGNGATSSTYYGDGYHHNDNTEEEYVLYHGGGWSSAESAGLFSYAVLSTKDEGSMNASCRLMYVK